MLLYTSVTEILLDSAAATCCAFARIYKMLFKEFGIQTFSIYKEGKCHFIHALKCQ